MDQQRVSRRLPAAKFFRHYVVFTICFCLNTSASCVVAQSVPMPSEAFLKSIPADQEALIRDFVEQRKKLRDVYRNMSLDASITSERAKPPGSALKKTKGNTGSLATLDGKWFRLDGVYSGTPGVAILGPEEGFIFGRGDKPDAWFLVNRFPANSRLIDQYTSSYRFDSHPLDCGDFYAVVYGVPQQDEIIELQSLVESGEGSSRTVTAKLLSRRPLENGQLYHTFTRVVFLANQCWATKEWLHASAESKRGYYVILQRMMEYEGDSDGVPLLKKSIEESNVAMFEGSRELCEKEYLAGPVLVGRRDTSVVTRFEPTPPPMSTFDHQPYLKAAGGLGEILSPARTAIIVVLNAVLLLLLGLWLLLSRRSKKQQSADSERPVQTR